MRPFDAMECIHKFNVLLLAFLALALMILYICEQPCTARRAESWVLHCVCGLEVSGGECVLLHEYKRKRGEPPLIKGFLRVRAGTGDFEIEKCCGKGEPKIK